MPRKKRARTPALAHTRTPRAATTTAATATAASWLDQLQKGAHASEREPDNTSPAAFVAASLCLAAGANAASSAPALGPLFLWAARAGVGSHWLGFALSLVLGTCKWFDVTEDIGIMYMLLFAFRSISERGSGAPSPRQTVMFALACVWCLRLVVFVGYRVVVRGRDFRFDKLMRGRAYAFFAYTAGGIWCWANGFCLWVVASVDAAADTQQRPPWPLFPSARGPMGWVSAFDIVGFTLFSSGLAVEMVADIQKYRFNAAHASGANANFIDVGLWSWSRHPNYVGEITLWSGLSVMCLAAHGVLDDPIQVALVCVTPMWSAFFLVFTSMMLLEKRGDAKWGRTKAWNEYKARTPVLFPWSLPRVAAWHLEPAAGKKTTRA